MERRRYEPTDFDVFLRRLSAKIAQSASAVRIYQRELKSFVNHFKKHPKRKDFEYLTFHTLEMLIAVLQLYAKLLKKTYFYYQSTFNYKRGFDFF